MNNPREVLPRTVAVLEDGMRQGLHIGAQAYVSIGGQPVADFGLGESRSGVPMDEDSMMVWWSATKPTAAIAIGQLWERGLLDVEDRVAQHIPEFAAKGKEAVTLRHLLTHTGGFRFVDMGGAPGSSWDEIIATICAAELEPGWAPGKKAGYHPSSSWYVLGEIVRRLDGRTFDRYAREELFEPLGMNDCWVGMPPERYREYGDRIGVMHNTLGDKPEPVPLIDSEEGCARCVPAGTGRGPMRELGRFYEMLLFRGALGEARIVSPQTVTAMTARHRTGMFDKTFRVPVDWGLGFAIDTFVYGRHCSPRTFGHGGARSSAGFCDPEHGLVVAVVTNGMPADSAHYPRFNKISTAIYEDLGIAEAEAPGRDKEQPDTGLA
ncbi:MAG: beta-lactamase family protein [Chloroflexi bacterium]|nr:beta-lactamase family protein [Chloroflexota bacterium]